MSDVI